MVSDSRNEITLLGSEATLQELINNQFNPEVYLPTPEYSPDKREWIDWRYKFWGTKYVSGFKVLRRGAKGVVLTITSTRGPPVAFFKHLLEKFNDLQIKCVFKVEESVSGVWIAKRVDGQVCVKEVVWEDFEDEEYYEAFHSK